MTVWVKGGDSPSAALVGGLKGLQESLLGGPRTERLGGRRLSCLSTVLIWSGSAKGKSAVLGKDARTSPLVCSFSRRSQEWYGLAKKNRAPSNRNTSPLLAVIVYTSSRHRPSRRHSTLSPPPSSP